MHHDCRFGDAEARAAEFDRHGDAEKSALGHRLVELVREARLAIARRPVIIAEAARDFRDALGDRALLVGKFDLHGTRSTPFFCLRRDWKMGGIQAPGGAFREPRQRGLAHARTDTESGMCMDPARQLHRVWKRSFNPFRARLKNERTIGSIRVYKSAPTKGRDCLSFGDVRELSWRSSNNNEFCSS